MASVKFFAPPYINGRNVENVTLRFLTNCVCVKRLLIKFEVASVYGHYYSDFYFTLLYWSTGRGMSFYAILTVYAHY